MWVSEKRQGSDFNRYIPNSCSEANFGGIMFGGYDTGKFTGDLIALPIQPDVQAGGITSMTVAWTSLSLTDPKKVHNLLQGRVLSHRPFWIRARHSPTYRRIVSTARRVCPSG